MVPFLMSWNLLMCNRHSHIISIKWPFFSIIFFPYIFEHHCLKMKYLICLNMYLILYLHVYLVFIFLFVTDAISPSLSDVIYAYVCDFICVSICYYIGQCILCIWCKYVAHSDAEILCVGWRMDCAYIRWCKSKLK